MNTNLSAAELRRWASRCDERMRDPNITGAEHEHLVKMRNGLLAVAESQDWLDGVGMKETV